MQLSFRTEIRFLRYWVLHFYVNQRIEVNSSFRLLFSWIYLVTYRNYFHFIFRLLKLIRLFRKPCTLARKKANHLKLIPLLISISAILEVSA